MAMLRSRIESRADFILKSKGSGDEYQELSRVLELVKNGELILNELSGKIEAARFLEEFVTIINGAAESVSAVKSDVENLVPLAESALAKMEDAISKVSGGLYTPNCEQAQIDTQNSILAEAKAAMVQLQPIHEQKERIHSSIEMKSTPDVVIEAATAKAKRQEVEADLV